MAWTFNPFTGNLDYYTGTGGGGGTVTSVGLSFTGGLISVSGSPIATSGTLALTVAGTSGGIPYFNGASSWTSSGVLTANAIMVGGGAGAAPSTVTTGTGVLTALGNAVNAAGGLTTIDGTATLTSKRINPRVVTIADATSITINGDTTDVAIQANTQAAGTLTINAPTGTPVDGQKLVMRVVCTNSQTLSWNAIFAFSTDIPAPSATTGSSKYDYFGFMYNAAAVKWQLVSNIMGF